MTGSVEALKALWLPRLAVIGLTALAGFLPFSVAGMYIALGLLTFLALFDFATPPRLGWRRTPIDEPLMVFLGISLVSSLLGADPWSSLRYFGGSWVFLLPYIVVWYAPDRRALRRLCAVALGVAALFAIYAVVQHYTGVNIKGKGLASVPFAVEGFPRYIARGTFSHHQTFANVYLLFFCLAFSFALVPQSRRRRAALAVVAALLLAAVVVSFTRGVWLATLVAALVVSLLKNRRLVLWVTVLALAAVLAAAIVPSVLSTRARSIFSTHDNLDRFIIWETSWSMLRDRPLTGIGIGNYGLLQENYLYPHLGRTISKAHAHNTYLQLMVERGLPALVAFLWLWYGVLRTALGTLGRIRGHDSFRVAAVRGAVAGVAGFLVDGFFQNNFGDTEVLAVLVFLVALILSLRVTDGEAEATASVGG